MRPANKYWIKFFACLLFWGNTKTHAQNDTAVNFKFRKTIVIAGNGLGYASLMTGLSQLWYKDFKRTSFHWFNDNHSWLQMDKMGHVYSCYYEGLLGKEMMEWAGYNHKTATLIGGSYGFAIQLGIEVFDGFSKKWGASWGDLLANGVGSGLYIGQEMLWKEQRITAKFSFWKSEFASLRPDLLGVSFAEQMMKDYNGQNHWLSVNLKSFMRKESNFPPWLNLALGYGANGMLGGTDNIFEKDGINHDYSEIKRQRQFYLSPDIDFTKIPVESKALKIFFRLLNGIKVPLPAIEYRQKDNFYFQWIQF